MINMINSNNAEDKIDDLYRVIEAAKQALTTASPDQVRNLQLQVNNCYCMIAGIMHCLGLIVIDEKEGNATVPLNSNAYYNLRHDSGYREDRIPD